MLGATLVVAALGSLAAVLLAGNAGASNSVTLCHLADGPANAGLISVAPAAAYNGHFLQHSADVIPPFQFQGQTYSLNWDPTIGFGVNELCGEGTPTDTGGTTTDEEPPPTTTDEPPCEETLAGQMLGCGPPPDDGDVCLNLGGVQTTIPVGYIAGTDLTCSPRPDDPPAKHHRHDPPGTEIGDCVVQTNESLICGEQG